MENLHRCAAQDKIEIKTWNLGDIFFLFFLNHMSYRQHKNSKIPQIRTTLIYIYVLFICIKQRSTSLCFFFLNKKLLASYEETLREKIWNCVVRRICYLFMTHLFFNILYIYNIKYVSSKQVFLMVFCGN